MRRKFLPALLAPLLVGALGPTIQAAPRAPLVPGQRVGKVRLGDTLARVNQILGTPTTTDGAAGTIYETWSATGKFAYRLDLYGTLKVAGPDYTIRAVRIESPYFATASGIGVGSPWSRIHRAFPGLKRLGSYENRPRPTIDLYDDPQRGIAFEIRRTTASRPGNGVCVAVYIHAPGKPVRPLAHDNDPITDKETAR